MEPARLPPHVQKHVADQVLCRGFIPDNPDHKPKDSDVVAGVQHLHRKPVAVCYSSNQHLV